MSEFKKKKLDLNSRVISDNCNCFMKCYDVFPEKLEIMLLKISI